MKNFWNSDITEASWIGLQDLRKEIDFVLIGGWAVYLYSRLQKSKDIDVIVDYGTLRYLKANYALVKNDRLSKYEIKKDRYDIDIYLPNYSVLTLPPKDIMARFSDSLEGFTVPTPEALMVLKLGAASDRLRIGKGAKDAIDVLALLFYSGLSMERLGGILSEYGLGRLMGLLAAVLGGFDRKDVGFLNLNENSFAKLKRRWLAEIKEY